MSERASLIEAVGEPGTGRWRIRIIRSGLSGNGVFYPDSTLRAAAPLFDGARVFVKGDAEHLAGQGKDFRNLIGRIKNARFVEGAAPDAGEVQGDMELIEPGGDLARKLREAWDRGMADTFGFSIDATGAASPGRIAGKPARFATAIDKVNSVDLIVEPGAGGQLVNLIESRQEGTRMDYLSQEVIGDLVKGSNLPKAAQDRLIRDHKAPSKVTETELREAIDYERQYVAGFSESGHVRGLGDFSREAPAGERRSKIDEMLDAFFDPEHKDHRHAQSIREIYIESTGDKRFTGMLANCDPVRFRESLLSTSFPNVLGNSITRRMVAEYNRIGLYDVFRPIVSVVPVNDFRTNERVRFGGYGDMPTVDEGQPYAALASPTDEKATYAIKKRGGTEDVTLEMIANDDVGTIRRIPDRMVNAAKRTIAKFVLDLIRTNPVIYDGIALFHATHANLGTLALDAAQLAAGRLAMMKQTELNSADRLGIGPKSVLVPLDLQETTVNLFNRNTNLDKTFIQETALMVLPVWYWTDSNDWALAADPNDLPTIEVGFLGGRQEPEVFIQDMPNVGSMFSHDKTTYKIRHIYGAVVNDFRGLWKAVVP